MVRDVLRLLALSLLVGCDEEVSRGPRILDWDETTPFGFTGAQAVESLQVALDEGLSFSWAGQATCWQTRSNPARLLFQVHPDPLRPPVVEEAYFSSTFVRSLTLGLQLEVEIEGDTHRGGQPLLTFEPDGRRFRVTAPLLNLNGGPTPQLLLVGEHEDAVTRIETAALLVDGDRVECINGACPTLAISPPDADPICDGCCNRYAWM